MIRQTLHYCQPLPATVEPIGPKSTLHQFTDPGRRAAEKFKSTAFDKIEIALN
jgi:hypothetical protein